VEGLQVDDADIRADALVSEVWSAMDLPQPIASQRVSAALGAIREAPDGLRLRCFLRAVAVPNEAGRHLLVSLFLSEPTVLTVDEVASLLPGLSRLLPFEQQPLAKTGAAALLSQAEAIWPDLDDAGKTELRAAILLATPKVKHAAAAVRLRRLAAPDTGVPYTLIDEASGVGKALRAALESVAEPDEAKARLIAVLSGYPATGKPSRTWRSDAEAALADLNDPVTAMRALLDAAIGAPDYLVHHELHGYHTESSHFATPLNEAFLCATTVLASRAAAGSAPDDGGDLLSRLRQLALRTITGKIRIPNHCVQGIADAALPSSITELLRTERGTRHGSLLRAVRTAIEALAAAQGLTRDELLEMAVEDHGLGSDGTGRTPLAEGWLAVIQASERTASVSYTDPHGETRKSLPAAIKQASDDGLAAVTKDLKAIRVTISNERARLDSCLAAGRCWSVPQWRRRCLGHPVTGRLARTLIWTFNPQPTAGAEAAVVTGIPVTSEVILTSDGAEVPIPETDAAEVTLWHPVHATADEVRAWRQLLLDRRLLQPVKQAFREVYVLTPAEEATVDYSNRFAGHVFEQPRARALMKGRSWTPVPLAWWDDGIHHGIARRLYPGVSGSPALRAEFFFDPADDQDYAGDLYRYCASDQVRFFDPESDVAVRLAEVPPLIFSEAMRDVDLFIGVTSVGADPEWLDRGAGRQFGDYWHRYAFGDLGVGAEIRREVLAGLVPMLAIADRCDLEDRFLKVRGDLRGYRIHLGSGNILMTPNDQYLCIVSARDGRAGKLFLPFDDDPVLSLILSKAFLLAADAAITDESITRQILRK
jgi:Domain of unknown function (DUF4132)